jgi:hypothetical protein
VAAIAVPRTKVAVVPSLVTTAVWISLARANAEAGMPPSAFALDAVVAVAAVAALSALLA